MTPEKSSELEKELDKYFNLFEPTIKLVENLIKEEENAQEVLLLLCARLDALASCIAADEQSNRDSFTRLVTCYGRHRSLMSSVSAGDLYYEIGYQRWYLARLLPKPGRIVRTSQLNDTFISLLEQSDIPLTREAAHALLTRIMRAIERRCRCRARQPMKKPSTLSPNALTTAIENEFRLSRDVEVEKLCRAIQPLIQWKTVAALLYENFRNEAVHGIKVNLDERRFFRETRPYWHALREPGFPTFLFLKFPAPFLLTLLRDCMKTLRVAWIAKGQVPHEAYWHMYGSHSDQIHLVDTSVFAKPRALRLQRPRS